MRITTVSLLLGLACLSGPRAPAGEPKTKAPKVWDEAELAEWATPLAGLGKRPGHFSTREYYAAPVDNLRTYPVYHPDREPEGHWEKIKALRPEPLIETGQAFTEEEWAREGRRVFEELDVPFVRSGDAKLIDRVRSKKEMAGVKVRTKDGTVAGLRWVVTGEGIKLGVSECAGCHVRVMPDGTRLHGAPANTFERDNSVIGSIFGELFGKPVREFFKGDTPGETLYREFGVPWIKPDVHEKLKTMSEAELGAMFGTRVNGVFARFNGSPFYLTKFPGLIGVKDVRYFDHTGTHAHRGPGDLARYAALVSVADPADFGEYRMLTDAQRRILYRHPDEAFYALALYVYSLKPPPSPHPFDDKARAGQAVFEREGCGECHPKNNGLYTNNRLIPATGFTPPKAHRDFLRIADTPVGTDPNLALKTRKGTGYYKVPSLRGLWYRGLYLHDGSLANLEDLFDPARLKDDYEPTGFKGYRFNEDGKGEPVKHRTVRGHEFGMALTPEDHKALIAFLKTL